LFFRKAELMLFGIPTVTIPAPLRMAASAQSRAAPENPAEPARTRIFP